MRVDDIDWEHWQPRQRATLLFIVRERQILLISKKRGLGAGNINGPGGRIEPGETALQAAIREVQEELCITPLDPRHGGTLAFQFTNGLSIHCDVFSATAFEGTPTETDEAIPMWFPLAGIPYERMWADDRIWLPQLLKQQPFRGFFIFDDARLLDFRLDLEFACQA